MGLKAASELANTYGFHEDGNLYKEFFKKQKTPIEQTAEANLELLIKKVDQILFNGDEDTFFKSLTSSKTFGYLEGYGYYVLKHSDFGESRYAFPKRYSDKSTLFDSELFSYLYNRFRNEEQDEKIRETVKNIFFINGLGTQYFPQYYIYLRMLECYAKYYNGNIPDKIVSKLLDDLNRAYEDYNPEIENRFTYNQDNNSFVMFSRQATLK